MLTNPTSLRTVAAEEHFLLVPTKKEPLQSCQPHCPAKSLGQGGPGIHQVSTQQEWLSKWNQNQGLRWNLENKVIRDSHLILERDCLIQTGKDRKRSFPREQGEQQEPEKVCPKSTRPFWGTKYRTGLALAEDKAARAG